MKEDNEKKKKENNLDFMIVFFFFFIFDNYISVDCKVLRFILEIIILLVYFINRWPYQLALKECYSTILCLLLLLK